jgi:hypothetical protein
MGGEQAAGVLATVRRDAIERQGGTWSAEEEAAFKRPTLEMFEEQSHPLYASARLWDDGIVDPRRSREVLALSLSAALNAPIAETRFGVFRMCTGGTLDKLDSVPGYATWPDIETFRRVVAETGARSSADGRSRPRRPQALRHPRRDRDGGAIDLITASILSKKLAAGLDALVLDVKCGSGAFMATPDEADALARSLVAVANGAGCRTAALMTDMDEPLASAAGNALEVANACAFLTGAEIDARLWDVTVALGGEAAGAGRAGGGCGGGAREDHAGLRGGRRRSASAHGRGAGRTGRSSMERFARNPARRALCAGRAAPKAGGS